MNTNSYQSANPYSNIPNPFQSNPTSNYQNPSQFQATPNPFSTSMPSSYSAYQAQPPITSSSQSRSFPSFQPASTLQNNPMTTQSSIYGQTSTPMGYSQAFQMQGSSNTMGQNRVGFNLPASSTPQNIYGTVNNSMSFGNNNQFGNYPKYKATQIKEDLVAINITNIIGMQEYGHKSVEELRFEDKKKYPNGVPMGGSNLMQTSALRTSSPFGVNSTQTSNTASAYNKPFGASTWPPQSSSFVPSQIGATASSQPFQVSNGPFSTGHTPFQSSQPFSQGMTSPFQTSQQQNFQTFQPANTLGAMPFQMSQAPFQSSQSFQVKPNFPPASTTPTQSFSSNPQQFQTSPFFQSQPLQNNSLIQPWPATVSQPFQPNPTYSAPQTTTSNQFAALAQPFQNFQPALQAFQNTFQPKPLIAPNSQSLLSANSSSMPMSSAFQLNANTSLIPPPVLPSSNFLLPNQTLSSTSFNPVTPLLSSPTQPGSLFQTSNQPTFTPAQITAQSLFGGYSPTNRKTETISSQIERIASPKFENKSIRRFERKIGNSGWDDWRLNQTPKSPDISCLIKRPSFANLKLEPYKEEDVSKLDPAPSPVNRGRSFEIEAVLHNPNPTHIKIPTHKNMLINDIKTYILRQIKIPQNSIVQLVFKSTVAQEDDTIGSLGVSHGDIINIVIAEEGPSKSEMVSKEMLPKLTNEEYTISPSMIELARMTKDEITRVKDFTIENSYGKIIFEGETNLIGVDLDQIIKIGYREAIIYPDDSENQKPKVGEELNKSATIMLYKCAPDRESEEKFVEKLKKSCLRNRTQYIGWDKETQIYTFKING
ncbi:unnamed protein product [Blepharisma stoltei]|uniref:Peptidase S59 domain-containing protein n=1 Tax=Blepharisma stoltei TaxID=1481888 RepID=A0AAU9J211_9CILI|nr:unnamed protein product [Blepharisma stoltei]